MRNYLPLFAACLLIVTCQAADQRFGALAPGDRVVTNEDDAVALAYAHALSDALQQPNSLTLFGNDLYRKTIIDGPTDWLDWQVLGVVGQSTVGVWAHWDYAVLNADGSADDDQVLDFGASDYGQFAWILDPFGNYRVPQEWQDGDHFANVGPDAAIACWWDGWQWEAGETTADDAVIDAVGTGWGGSDYQGAYDEIAGFPIEWAVSDDRRQVSYTIDWQPSGSAPPCEPTYKEAGNVAADILIRPVADLAFVIGGGAPGNVCTPDGSVLASLGNDALDPPVAMSAGAYFDYSFIDWCPGVYGPMPVNLDNSWLYGYERQYRWIQVPSALEVTNTVNAALTDYYPKVDVDGLVDAGGATLADFVAGFPAAALAIASNCAAGMLRNPARAVTRIDSTPFPAVLAANGNLQYLPVTNNPCVVRPWDPIAGAFVEDLDLEINGGGRRTCLHSTVTGAASLFVASSGVTSVILRHGVYMHAWSLVSPITPVRSVDMMASGAWTNNGSTWWSSSGWSGACCQVGVNSALFAGGYKAPEISGSATGMLFDVQNGNGGAFVMSPIFSNGVTVITMHVPTKGSLWAGEPLVTSVSTDGGTSWSVLQTNVCAAVSMQWNGWNCGDLNIPVNLAGPVRLKFSNPYRINNDPSGLGNLILQNIVVNEIK